MFDAPQPFPGTPEEIEANRQTHWFDYETDRCGGCDCRPWGRTAEWPCGTRVPRTTDDTALDEFLTGFAIYAAVKEA
jgi:hypothetical protein